MYCVLPTIGGSLAHEDSYQEMESDPRLENTKVVFATDAKI